MGSHGRCSGHIHCSIVSFNPVPRRIFFLNHHYRSVEDNVKVVWGVVILEGSVVSVDLGATGNMDGIISGERSLDTTPALILELATDRTVSFECLRTFIYRLLELLDGD